MMTFLAALRFDHLSAPYVIDGAIDGHLFGACVDPFSAPSLRSGDIVVVDNPASHKFKTGLAAIRSARAHLAFLPPHSPDLNAIEQVFQRSNIGRTWRNGSGAPSP